MLLLYRRRWGLFYVPVLIAAALAAWAAAQYLFPLPPRSLLLANPKDPVQDRLLQLRAR